MANRAVPSTLKACQTMIRQLRGRVRHLEKQCEADSFAMNKLVDAVNSRDKLLLEKCKTCNRMRI